MLRHDPLLSISHTYSQLVSAIMKKALTIVCTTEILKIKIRINTIGR